MPVTFKNFQIKLMGILSLGLVLQSFLAGNAQQDVEWPCLKTKSRISLLNEAKAKGVIAMQNPKRICKETQKGNDAMYVLHGKKVRVGKANEQGLVPLTFNPPPDNASFLSVSRPSESSGHMALKTYLMAWGEGPYSFKNFGPNATLNAIDCKNKSAIPTQMIRLTSNGMIPEFVADEHLTFYAKGLSPRHPLMPNQDLCSATLTLVNSCTPSGKGSRADWGPCYLHSFQQQ